MQKVTLGMLALVDFFCFCSMSIMAPYFPKEAALKGVSNTMSGIVFSFYALVMFITSPIFGKIVSCLFDKKSCAYWSVFSCRKLGPNPCSFLVCLWLALVIYYLGELVNFGRNIVVLLELPVPACWITCRTTPLLLACVSQ